MNTSFWSFGVAVLVSVFAQSFSVAHAESTGELITFMENSLDQPAALDFEAPLAKAEIDGAVCVIVELDI